jgi:hypothetical protein
MTCAIVLGVVSLCGAIDGPIETPSPSIRVVEGHPWRPPFGLDRVGRPLNVVVEVPAPLPSPAEYAVAALRGGSEIGREVLRFPNGSPGTAKAALDGEPDELVLFLVAEPNSEPVELARRKVERAEFEAEAVARAEPLINPVDLGTIFVPADVLLIGPGQTGVVEAAVLGRTRDISNARVEAWYESDPESKAGATLTLERGRRRVQAVRLPAHSRSGDRDVARVVIYDDLGRMLWTKAIPVMLVQEPPRLPAFGATSIELRYDGPISIRDPATGRFSEKKYEDGWDPALGDVVVSLPNGARFVFWRGSSYIPFWAGRHNTGLCYEWAELLGRPQDAVDCVEPLMDKELRYGRVQIVESTAARVHVRWSYQSTDLNYKVWGDSAGEDYYFYPDGFGTRVVSLLSAPGAEYELSEFIVLAPSKAYPFAFLPEEPIELLALEGGTHRMAFPIDRDAEAGLRRDAKLPAVYRVRPHEDESQTAVYFNPGDRELPPVIFGSFSDGGEVVTPCYWGSHWPLARGNATGNSIDDRIDVTPSHNSLMSWARSRPDPVVDSTLRTLDALGRPRTMELRRWAWLIGMSEATDAEILRRARSFAEPPAVEARGARLDFPGYAGERRALRLVVEDPQVAIAMKPGVPVVNPVFELRGAPKGLRSVGLDGNPLPSGSWAWDGRVLWLGVTIPEAATLSLDFEDRSASE